MGCGIETCQVVLVVRDGAQGGTGDPTAVKQLCNSQLKELEDLELDKAGFRSNKDNKEIVSNAFKWDHT